MRLRPIPLGRAVRVAAGRGAGVRDVAGILAVLEMRQDALDHRRIFDRGDHFHLTATDLIGFYLNLEHPLQALRPRHRRVAIGRGLLRARRLAGSAPSRGHCASSACSRRG